MWRRTSNRSCLTEVQYQKLRRTNTNDCCWLFADQLRRNDMNKPKYRRQFENEIGLEEVWKLTRVLSVPFCLLKVCWCSCSTVSAVLSRGEGLSAGCGWLYLGSVFTTHVTKSGPGIKTACGLSTKLRRSCFGCSTNAVGLAGVRIVFIDRCWRPDLSRWCGWIKITFRTADSRLHSTAYAANDEKATCVINLTFRWNDFLSWLPIFQQVNK